MAGLAEELGLTVLVGDRRELVKRLRLVETKLARSRQDPRVECVFARSDRIGRAGRRSLVEQLTHFALVSRHRMVHSVSC